MNNLRVFNEKLFKESMILQKQYDLSAPNLVSSKRFLKTIKENPILYIGQETNCWVNDNSDSEITIDTVEDAYDDFVIDYNGVNTVFWQFIKSIIDNESIANNVVWTNTLLMGKRYEKGTPTLDEKLLDISFDNLVYLYKYFNPQHTIIVAGNRNPYYTVLNRFLKEIDSSLSDKWPTSTEPLISDYKNSIFMTYHPMYLRKSKNYESVLLKIKTNYKK